MKIQLDLLNLKSFFLGLKKVLKGNLSLEGFQYSLELPPKNGKGTIKGYDFSDGLSLIKIKADINTILQIKFSDDLNHIIRYIFVTRGSLIHSVSPNLRYRLNSYSSSIAASKAEFDNQEIVIPAQNDLEAVIIQIDTREYTEKIDLEVLNKSKELSNIYLTPDTRESDYFLYQSIYTLNISETIVELNKSDVQGLVKRFYVESKTLELLWVQTQNYINEQVYGYDKYAIRQTDLELIKKAKQYIYNNYQKDITLRALARVVGTNETKLKKGFKKLYGKTFGEILRNERLLKAKTLLEEGNQNITEIARSVGYSSSSTFTRRFKEKYEILPVQYRGIRRTRQTG